MLNGKYIVLMEISELDEFLMGSLKFISYDCGKLLFSWGKT